MSSRRLLIVAICLTWIWASSASLAIAQPADSGNAGTLHAISDKFANGKERAIEYRLLQPITLQFKNMPLREVADLISAASKVRVEFDFVELRDANVNFDAPVSFAVEDISMKSALHLLFSPARLRFYIEEDRIRIGLVYKGRLTYRSYPVGDLIVPIPLFEGQKLAETLEKQLMEVIKKCVDRNSWEQRDGQASIDYHSAGNTLLIKQCNDNHEEIEQLLASLRQLQGPTIHFELGLVEASNTTGQQWKNVLRKHGQPIETLQFIEEPIPGNMVRLYKKFIPEPSGTGYATFVTVDEKQVKQLLDLANNDRLTSCIQPPKINIYNGQEVPLEFRREASSRITLKAPPSPPSQAGALQFGSNETKPEQILILSDAAKLLSGWHCTLQPLLSHDRRWVRTKVEVEYQANDGVGSDLSKVKAAKTFNLSDGSTLVWDLGEVAKQHLFVLVKPRVRNRADAQAKAQCGDGSGEK